MAAVLYLGTAHLARVVVLKRQDSGETKARHYVAYGLKVGQTRFWEVSGEVLLGRNGQTEWSHGPFRTHT